MDNDSYIRITQNPLSDIISDDIFETLMDNGLLDEKSIRDYAIRRKFKLLRENNFSAADAIEKIMQDYPYLQFDTLKKLVYKNE